MAKGTKTLLIVIKATDKQARKVFKSLKAGLSGVVKAGKRVGLGLAAGFSVAAVAVTAFTTSVLNSQDALIKEARQLGITAQELASLRETAKFAGIGLTEIAKAAQFMQRNIAEAADGTAAQADAFEKLGLNIDDIKKLDTPTAMQKITTAMRGLTNQTDKTQVAMDIFGRSGAKLLNTTAEAFERGAAEAKAFGLAMDEVSGDEVEKINDNLTTLKSALGGFGVQVVAALSGPLLKATEAAKAFAKSADFKIWAQEAAAAILSVAGALVRTIPKAMLIVLEVINRVTQAFRGWDLLWGELKIGFLSFQGLLFTGLNNVRNALTETLQALNVGGVFDSQIEESKRIASEQKTILDQVARDKQQIIKDQSASIQKGKEEAQTVDSYKQKIEEITGSFNTFAKSIDGSAASVDKEVESVDALTAAFDRAAASKQRLVSISVAGSSGDTGQRTFGDESRLRELENQQGG